MPMVEIRHVFILGNHIQALGLARMAAKLGLRVTLFNGYGASVTRFSAACNRFFIFKNQQHLLELLAAEAPGKDTLLVATNDDLIGFLARHFDFLSRNYLLSIPRPEIVETCFNKRATYRRAVELGIPIPESHFPDSLDELMALAGQLRFPLILKPAVMYKFHGATGKKVYFCTDEKSLVANYEAMRQIIPADEVIVQEFLLGGAKSLFSFGSFFAEGEVFGGFSVNRIRQKPMDFGISTSFARTVLSPEIENLALKFLKGIDYFGMSEVEFMLDESTGTYKLLEINPRSWKWHSIANKLDIPLFEMMVRYLEQKPVERKINQLDNIGWIERLTDTYVVLGEILRGRMSLSEYLGTLRIPKESAAWSLADPLPSVMYVLMSPLLLIKRN